MEDAKGDDSHQRTIILIVFRISAHLPKGLIPISHQNLILIFFF